MILATKRVTITETTNPPGAWLYDSEKERIFGLKFKTAEAARNFLSFVEGVDVTGLDWDQEHDDGRRLLELWASCDYAPRRPPPVFEEDWLLGPDEDEKRWSFICEVRSIPCFPLFLGVKSGCYGVEDLLVRDGVITEEVITDTEFSCFYAYFPNRQSAIGFLRRFNKWLKDNWHKAYSP